MDIWKDIGISSKNTTEHPCFQKAYLFEKCESGIIKKEFDYESVAEETYQEVNGLIGEYTTKSKTIFTPFYWLNFKKGARVEMASGIFEIKDIVVVQDNKKAQFDNKGIVGVRIVF